MAKTEVSMKLLIDTKANKVLFAEASKDFVDFLFHIMSLPVGTVVNLLTVSDMVGCLGVLYKSIESLSTDYFQVNSSKDSVLKPTTPANVPLLSLSDAPTTDNTSKNFYCCGSRCQNNISGRYQTCVTDDPRAVCPQCRNKMSYLMSYVAPQESTEIAASSRQTNKGYVKGVVTYMVMDNLEVKPMSTISGITLMNKFQVKDIGCLVEKEVHVTLKEGVAILKASMETQAVLTTVFLRKMKI